MGSLVTNSGRLESQGLARGPHPHPYPLQPMEAKELHDDRAASRLRLRVNESETRSQDADLGRRFESRKSSL